MFNKVKWVGVKVKGLNPRGLVKNGVVFYRAPAVSIINMIPNGSFETNATGWTLTGSNPALARAALPVANPLVTYSPNAQCLRCNGSANAQFYIVITPALSITSGRIYYITACVRTANTNCNGVSLFNNTTALFGSNGAGNSPPSGAAPISGTSWNRVSFRWTANSASLTLRFEFNRANGNNAKDVAIDNIMVIDLTGTFGSGQEPSLQQMNDIVSGMGGYWDTAALY